MRFSLAAGLACRQPGLAVARRCRVRTQGRGIGVGQPAGAPYVLDYDLVGLAIASAFFARYDLHRGFRDFVPLPSRSIAGVTTIPLGQIVMLDFYAVVLRRAPNRASVIRIVRTCCKPY